MRYIALVVCSLFFLSQTVSADPGDEKIKELKMAIAELSAPEPHCEVPCGIYGDSLRVALISEHISTVEKAMNQINELSKAETPNYNQLVRWVMNKESHAEEIQEIVSQYFLHQRIKFPKAGDRHAGSHYAEKLKNLHAISVYAMKSKQGTDLAVIESLRDALLKFEESYFTHSH